MPVLERLMLYATFLMVTAHIFGFTEVMTVQAQGDRDVYRTFPLLAKQDDTVDPHRQYFEVGENGTVTDDWRRNHTRNPYWTYGLNMIAPDSMYDPATRKTLVRTLIVRDVNDPPEVRLGRAPGTYPNEMDHTRLHRSYEITGIMGFEGWNGLKGFSGLKSGIQGAVAADPKLGMLYLSAATGKPGYSPDRSSYYDPDRLVPHAALYPHGTFEVGYGTDPTQRPQHSLRVLGDTYIAGTLYVKEIRYIR